MPPSLKRLRPIVTLMAALSLPFACAKRSDDRQQPAPGPVASSPAEPEMDMKTMHQVQLSPEAMRAARADAASRTSSASGSASASASTSASTSASASASTSASASAGVTKLYDFWVFSRFDMSDPSTKERWSKVPFDDQKAVLAEAPKATLEITKDALITRLLGTADDVTPYTVEAPSADAGADTIVIKTTKQGRKRIDHVDADTIRVEDLDKKDRMVTLFVRKKHDPKPAVSATPPPPKSK